MSLLDFFLGRTGTQPVGTPPFNPNAPDPRPQVPASGLDAFFNKPGGSMLMNLLAQSGRSLTPGPGPLGAIGRAALTTQQQQQQKELMGLQKGLMGAQIKNLLMPKPGDTPKASTDRGKAIQDFNNGLITRETLDKRLKEIDAAEQRLGNKDASTLRAERDKVLGASTEALQSLRAAESLLNAQNPFADVASMTSFIRSIDNSVVRPSEQANFDAALGLMNRIESIWQKAKGEGVLTPEAREALAASIAALRENYETIISGQEQFFIDEANRSGVDPVRVTRGLDPGSVEFKPSNNESDGADSGSMEIPDWVPEAERERINNMPDGPIKDTLIKELAGG